MVLTDYLVLAGLALSAAAVVLLAVLIVRMKKVPEGDANVKKLGEELAGRLDLVKDTLSKSIFSSMLDFNDQVNAKLLETNDKSGRNITEFRVDVNKELASFKEQISGKLNQDFKDLTVYLEGQMGKINQNVEARLTTEFTKTNETFVKITERIAVIDDAQKNIESLSSEMVSLQKILSNNQSRGMFGEYQLNQLLSYIYGDSEAFYQTQFTIREAKGKSESVRADAVVFMPDPIKMIAVDSKFPFAEYRKLFEPDLSGEDEKTILSAFLANVKKHITDIAGKYVIQGVTADFALMFVPSDGVLSLIHSKLPQVIELARTKNVTIVSPTTLIPLLSSFRAINIDHKLSSSAKKILHELHALDRDFVKFAEEWTKLVDMIHKMTNKSETLEKSFERISKKFSGIRVVEISEEPSEETSENESE
jgi:DNA recombination protein RmuC